MAKTSPGSPVLAFLRRNGLGLSALVVFVGLGYFAVRLISSARVANEPRKAMQFTIVNIQPVQPVKPPPPPPPEPKPQIQPKIEEQTTTRVQLKPNDFTPPDMSRPAPAAPGGGGRLSLAAEGEGPGDSFNLAGNPGGRSILSGGGLGEGEGDGSGDALGGGEGTGARFGWYYARIAAEMEEVLRKHRTIQTASVRVELRVWADPAGVVQKVQLLKSTGDPAVDEAVQSIVGLRLRQPPPPDIPMPMIARLTARRPR